MNANRRASKAPDSKAFKKAKSKAEEYAKDPKKTKSLIEKAIKKTKGFKGSKGPLGKLWEDIQTIVRMLKAYFKGDYTAIPWETIVILIAAMIYVVMPFDLIPDFLLGWGLLDDAVVVAFVVRSVAADINKYRQWEEENKK